MKLLQRPASAFLSTISLCLATASVAARADPISFQLLSSALATSSGGTVTFTGTITNGSGGDLNASDFFFNFSGFDPTVVTPTQVLPSPADFSIPNGMTSGTVDLFDVTLGSVSHGATFPVDVQLEDINNDLSQIQTVDVSVSGSGTSAAEPGTLLLLGTALAGMLARRWRSLGNCSAH